MSHPHRHRRRTSAAALLLGGLLVASACGSSSPAAAPATTTVPVTTVAVTTQPATTMAATTIPATTAAATTTTAVPAFPVTVTGANGPVTIATQPAAIVSLSPTATEMLFAVGAGKQVIAVDDQSNYPAEAPHSSLSGFQPNIEAIAAKKPDLVVISNDTAKLIDSLSKLGIKVLMLSAATTIDDVYAQMTTVGAATGHVAEATAATTALKSGVDAVVAAAPKHDKPLRYYYELDNTLYSVTSTTFVGRLLGLLGLQSIADPADKAGSGYPQLSTEYVIAANPDVILLADTKCCQQDAKAVGARPGWSGMAAVKAGHIVNLDDDVASRWGPRILDLLREVATATATLTPGTP